MLNWMKLGIKLKKSKFEGSIKGQNEEIQNQ
jgi:hypothetical protein